MKTIDVYDQYFAAKCVYNDRQRNGARVVLTAESCDGNIRYDASVTFFPHDSEDDFAISYDACASCELYSGKGRRSKKREAELMKAVRGAVDDLASSLGGRVFWDRPLREARMG